MKFFISHSSKDKELVLSFIDLLTKGFCVNAEDIFCTLMDDALQAGEDFIKGIKDELHDSEIVLFLITENYIASKFCIMEMGAAWAYKDNIVPLIVPSLDFSILADTPLRTTHAYKLDDAGAIFNGLYTKKLIEKNIIQRLSVKQERELLDCIEKFTKEVKKYVQNNCVFDFKEFKAIRFAQNGDPEAARIECKDGTHKLFCDFRPKEFYPMPSNFIGCIFRFTPHKNWGAISDDGHFEFECRSEDLSVNKITVEFKYGDFIKFYESTFKVTNEYRSICIPIENLLMPKKYLEDICEICFVIRPGFVDNHIGQIEFKNLQLKGDRSKW